MIGRGGGGEELVEAGGGGGVPMFTDISSCCALPFLLL